MFCDDCPFCSKNGRKALFVILELAERQCAREPQTKYMIEVCDELRGFRLDLNQLYDSIETFSYKANDEGVGGDSNGDNF